MTVIGGTAALIGQQYGVLGVSPMDCCGTAQGCGPDTMNLNAADINFICTEDIANFGMNLWDLVFTIAHEDGHTFGLAHNNRNQDIMYWAESGGETAGGLTWGAGTTRSGEQNCSANNYQDDCIDLTKAIGGGCPGHETTPPTVTITSPANNATLPAGPVAVTVDASDASGVVKVEMYVDTALKSTLVASPWSFDLLGVSAGAHQLVAKATDLYGTVGTSAAVTVTVSAPQPQCTVDADCGPGKRCVTGTCVAAPQCVADADCGANQWCVNNKCVAPSCVADSDCPNGLTCVANTCQSSQPTGAVFGADCDLNTDCQSGMCVSGTQHYCTQTCNPASPCPTGYSCQSDVCIADGIPPGATGSPCTKNSDCRTGICVDGSGDGYCTEVCHTGGPACPNGGDCAVAGDGATYLCGPTPVVVTPSGNTSGGCAAAPVGPAPIAGAVALLGLLGLARRRRSGR
jgi:uncharacterized protein (TIGR03382 family)